MTRYGIDDSSFFLSIAFVDLSALPWESDGSELALGNELEVDPYFVPEVS
jgi:hypothetical protein